MDNLYCKIYVNTVLPKTILTQFIANACHGKVTLRTISSMLFQIDVITNDEANPIMATSPEDGFIYYPYYLEIDPQDSAVEPALYITAIAKLLLSFWELGANAVAACDFEEELPRLASPPQPPATRAFPVIQRPGGIELNQPVSIG